MRLAARTQRASRCYGSPRRACPLTLAEVAPVQLVVPVGVAVVLAAARGGVLGWLWLLPFINTHEIFMYFLHLNFLDTGA